MASSEVEIASSSPFGCVLRDRNHHDGYRESSKVKATQAAFQRNIKNFVMDHLNTCISMSSDDSTTNENNINNNNCDKVLKDSKNLARLRLTRNKRNNVQFDKDESSLASLISPRHSRLLDRWAARQARELVSTLENENELLSNDNNVPAISRTSSSLSDECSSEISNLGASSLVQIWEKRLNQSNGSKSNTSMEKTIPNGGTNTISTCNNENVFIVEEQRGLDIGECFEGRLSGNEESLSSFTDWESDKTCDQSRWCSSESDRVSVADIIKKLTAPSQTQSPTPSFADDNDHEGCGSSSLASSPCRDFSQELSDQRALLPVTCSPRIRGRQAFNDLLMQLENDRHGELKNLAERRTVSKFTQRGRIQALLRLRLLQRSVATDVLSHQRSTSSEENKQVQPNGSAIMQLREKFSTGYEQKSTVQAEAKNTRIPRKDIVNSVTQLENASTSDQISKEISSQIAPGTVNHSIESTQKSVVNETREKDHPSSNVVSQETCFETHRESTEENSEATTSITDSNLNENEEETINHQCDDTGYDFSTEEGSNQNYAESSYEETEEENYDENNYDWISEISRPRSYWEERRQAWYKEILDTGSPNEDIQVLLQRKTVSSFLSSHFRETMDRLMQSHRGTQTQLVSSQVDEQDNEGLMAFFQERLRSRITPQENEIVETEEESINEEEEKEEKQDEQKHEEEQEVESLRSGLYNEVGDYTNESSSWSYRDNDAGDDFDRVASTSSQTYQSPSSYHDNRRNSSGINHHSIEMELIYDMRGHMEQLYQEMSELRKSIKSCLDMQMQLQQSMNRRVQTVEKEKKKSHKKKANKKGNCCICCEVKVDSVLYRCGHMCACMKCANELQWNNGKCPICRAKIDDVVRVYVDA